MLETRIAVVDDLPLDLDRLQKDIGEWLLKHNMSREVSCDAFANGEQFLRNRGLGGKYSIVFLDIVMEGMNGIETASRLKASQPDCMIVFVTTEKSYALEAHHVHPYDYLVKPYTPRQLDILLKEIFEQLNPAVEEIELRVPRGTVRLPAMIIPGAIAGFLPVKAYLRIKPSRLIFCILTTIFVLIPAGAGVCAWMGLPTNTILLPMVLVLFFVFLSVLKLEWTKAF